MIRSVHDWEYRVGKSLLAEAKDIGLLAPVSHSELDEFEGLFDFGHGLQTYLLVFENGNLIAYSKSGGDAISITQTDIAFRANTEKLFSKIASANGFQLASPELGQSSSVGLATREISGKIFKILIVLDDEWVRTFGTDRWIFKIAEKCESVILLWDSGQKTFPWPLNRQLLTRCEEIPSAKTNWTVPKSWYCHPEFGIASEGILEVFAEKKIIIDAFSMKVFVFGHELKLGTDSYTFRDFKGLAQMGTSPMGMDAFADKFLGYKVGAADETVRNTRTQARKALRKTFTDTDLLKKAIDLCMPDTPDKTVKSGFFPEDIEFFGTI